MHCVANNADIPFLPTTVIIEDGKMIELLLAVFLGNPVFETAGDLQGFMPPVISSHMYNVTVLVLRLRIHRLYSYNF